LNRPPRRRNAPSRRAARLLLALTLAPLHAALAQTALPVERPMPLGDFLAAHLAELDASYTPGLAWYAQSQRQAQEQARQALIDHLADRADLDPAHASDYAAMQRLIGSMAATGRVPLPQTDPRYLQGHPELAPRLAAGDSVVLPARPDSVTVLLDRGALCPVKFRPGTEALVYLQACAPAARPQTIWIVQPDGVVQQVGAASWNAQRQAPPAPGAWIWAPGPHWPAPLARAIADFLATQPPSQQLALAPPATDYAGVPTGTPDVPAPLKLDPTLHAPARDLPVSANDWGMPGLLQTPNARMFATGTADAAISHVYPYTRLNFFFQPLDWLQFGFRYTEILNQLYGPESFSGGQSYKDKSADVRVRLHQEDALWPEIAVGIQDVGGTGLFSGEYLAASKRSGDFDWTLGLGWGYLGERQDLPNPLGWLYKGFNTRPAADAGQGGVPGIKSFFRGRTAPFGGVQYQTPDTPLLLKLEFDPNNYQHEPLGNVLPQRSPINVGAVYALNANTDLSVGFERGNTLETGITFHGDLSQLAQPKVGLPAEEPLQAAYAQQAVASRELDLAPVNDSQVLDALAEDAQARELAGRVQTQCQCHVVALRAQGHALIVQIDNAPSFYLPPLVERIARVLVLHAPRVYTQFNIVFDAWGMPAGNFQVDRELWLDNHSQLQPPSSVVADTTAVAPPSPAELAGARTLTLLPPARFDFNVAPGYQQTLGGPNDFILYQLSATFNSTYRFTPDTWLAGTLSYGLLSNYSHFTATATSDLPQVRTDARQYATTSRLNVPLLQITHVGALDGQTYYSVYAGALESMFAGVGGEVLYRPWDSPVAFGEDLNYVAQRDFSQHFSLLPYRVLTGHATMYWETGFQDILAKLSAGRYLAGDIGATVDLSRTFSNGVQMGVYATKTNVSAARFGEGSFDKGLYLNVPFEAMLTRSDTQVAHFLWQPVLRDGGAMLNRAYTLYDLTRDDDLGNAAMHAPAP
jgi:hypothetical protein